MTRYFRIHLRALVWAVRHAGKYGTTKSRRNGAESVFQLLYAVLGFLALALTERVFHYRGILAAFRRREVDMLFIPFLLLFIAVGYQMVYKTHWIRAENVQICRSSIVLGNRMNGLICKVLLFLSCFVFLGVLIVCAVDAYPHPSTRSTP